MNASMPEKFGAGVYWITPVEKTCTDPWTGLLVTVTPAGSRPWSSVSLARTGMRADVSSKVVTASAFATGGESADADRKYSPGVLFFPPTRTRQGPGARA